MNRDINVLIEEVTRLIEIVFGESTKAAMKMAQRYDSDRMMQSAFGYIGRKPTQDELRKMYEGEALGGESEDVISIFLDLDIGPLSDELVSQDRKEILMNILMGPVGMVDYPEDRFNEKWTNYVADLDKLKEKASQGKSFRIWYSDAPSELCGYYFVCAILEAYDCPVSVIKLPNWIEGDDGSMISYKAWDEVDPGKFYIFLEYERQLSQSKLKSDAGVWRRLVSENGSLRASVNGLLKTVSENFYDDFIRRYLPDEPIRMARIIGNVLGKEELKIYDFWIRHRLRQMILLGELVLVQGGEHEYEFILKKGK
jgi:hypothetical protein